MIEPETFFIIHATGPGKFNFGTIWGVGSPPIYPTIIFDYWQGMEKERKRGGGKPQVNFRGVPGADFQGEDWNFQCGIF